MLMHQKTQQSSSRSSWLRTATQRSGTPVIRTQQNRPSARLVGSKRGEDARWTRQPRHRINLQCNNQVVVFQWIIIELSHNSTRPQLYTDHMAVRLKLLYSSERYEQSVNVITIRQKSRNTDDTFVRTVCYSTRCVRTVSDLRLYLCARLLERTLRGMSVTSSPSRTPWMP